MAMSRVISLDAARRGTSPASVGVCYRDWARATGAVAELLQHLPPELLETATEPLMEALAKLSDVESQLVAYGFRTGELKWVNDDRPPAGA
jgi:hypothetical protein